MNANKPVSCNEKVLTLRVSDMTRQTSLYSTEILMDQAPELLFLGYLSAASPVVTCP